MNKAAEESGVTQGLHVSALSRGQTAASLPDGVVAAGMSRDAIADEVVRRIHQALDPAEVSLRDDSAKHAGHAGGAGGAGHYAVRVVSERFAGKTRIARHRLVYDAVFDLVPHQVHALMIEALTPAEAQPR